MRQVIFFSNKKNIAPRIVPFEEISNQFLCIPADARLRSCEAAIDADGGESLCDKRSISFSSPAHRSPPKVDEGGSDPRTDRASHSDTERVEKLR